MIITAPLPTAIIGFALNDFFEGLYSSILFIGIGFLITGTFLFIAERVGSNKNDIKKKKDQYTGDERMGP